MFEELRLRELHENSPKSSRGHHECPRRSIGHASCIGTLPDFVPPPSPPPHVRVRHISLRRHPRPRPHYDSAVCLPRVVIACLLLISSPRVSHDSRVQRVNKLDSRNTIGEEEKSIQVVGRMPTVVKYILCPTRSTSRWMNTTCARPLAAIQCV
jgi:hypothetical protein